MSHKTRMQVFKVCHVNQRLTGLTDTAFTWYKLCPVESPKGQLLATSFSLYTYSPLATSSVCMDCHSISMLMTYKFI